ncbi:MAG: ABC transporter permease [Gemmatimonadaceae bacterium]
MLQDVRFALRTLRKSPGFTLVAVATLALGLGAVATIYSAVEAMLLRPLPFVDQGRLVRVYATKGGDRDVEVSDGQFVDLRARQRVFSDAAIYEDREFSLLAGSEPEHLSGGRVSPSLFRLLGARPLLGRAFRDDEEKPGATPVVLLGERVWRERLGADSAVVGRTVTLNGIARTVVGVMPATFRFPEKEELWVPYVIDPKFVSHGNFSYAIVARLREGVTLEAADADVRAAGRAIEREHTAEAAGWGLTAVGYRDSLLPGDVRAIILIFFGTVGFVLLIACANVANLMLTRATGRSREIAVRTALGAGRWRVARQLVVEGVLVALAGGALAVLVAMWGLDLIVRSIPVALPYWMTFAVNGNVIAFTAVTALGTGVLFSLAPAWQAAGVSLHEVLKEGGRSGGSTARRNRLRGALVAFEVALSLVLLVGAALMIRSFVGLQKADPGFDTRGLLTMRLPLQGARYDSVADRARYFARAVAAAAAVPGVRSAAIVSALPLGGSNSSSSVELEGQVVRAGEAVSVANKSIWPSYFETMRIPLLRGRTFTEAEALDTGATAVVINETFARRHLGGVAAAIGRRFRLGNGSPDNDNPWHTVVGVVPEVKQRQLNGRSEAQMYFPYATWATRGASLVVRVDGAPGPVAAPLRAALRGVDPAVPVFAEHTMEEVIRLSNAVWQSRLYGGMFAAFAGIALFLAAIGVYGVMAYSVSARTHEIGVRMALGARAGDVRRLVVRQGMRLALIGVAAGLPLAFGLARLLSSFLYGVTSSDPVTFAAVGSVLAGTALLACYLPARRATRVDPVVALRSE